MCTRTLELILKEKPQIMIGGPPLYLSMFRIKEENIQKGLKNRRQGNLKNGCEKIGRQKGMLSLQFSL